MDLTISLPPVGTSVQQPDVPGGADQQAMGVYLRVRPFSRQELCDDQDQPPQQSSACSRPMDCVVIESSQTVTLNAPRGSATMKSSEKGVGTTAHRFSFSQIFGPETTQAELYENTVQSQMSDFLDGKNVLMFSYGVTNAGKTFTIQGTPEEPGILPRVLDATFHHIGGDQYEGMDLKPYLRNDAQCLNPEQVKQERSAKAAIFASVKEHCDPVQASGGSESSLSQPSVSCSHTVLGSHPAEAGSSQFALWVAFFEIYNECVYDLLQPALCSKFMRRPALRVREDSTGNAYVKGLRWVNIQNMGEACKLLQFGNKKRSAAATKMNQSSSRSHSIFTMKLLKIEGSAVRRMSEFSLCDLAGSERCNKTNTIGERLKEAGNINNSLLILGKCITALRNNQTDGTKSSYIPFRESKLTKLFQAFFCGSGRASMIVNINQCASTYDETLHVMKFSAVARQVITHKPLESLAPCLVGCDGKTLVRNGMIDNQPLDTYLLEEELLDEDEADFSLLPQNELVNMLESLRTKLLAERRRNLEQEIEIRKEMGDAMLQQLMESEELRRREVEELKEGYQEKLENTFEMYKEAIKAHAYQSAMNSLEDNYVHVDEFIAEQEKVEVLRHKVSELETSTRGVSAVPTVDRLCQTEASQTADPCNWLHNKKRAIARACEDMQELILSLERRLTELSDNLQKVRDGFLEKSAALRRMPDDQAKSVADIVGDSVEEDTESTSLKAQHAKFSQPKTKQGLFASIRDAVTSPRKGTSGRALRRAVQTAQT